MRLLLRTLLLLVLVIDIDPVVGQAFQVAPRPVSEIDGRSGISADGSIILGVTIIPIDDSRAGARPVLWRPPGSLQQLESLGGVLASNAVGVGMSSDGTVVVGWTEAFPTPDIPSPIEVATRWVDGVAEALPPAI